MKRIKVPESNSVEVLAVMIKLRCRDCNSQWGIYLNEDGTFPQGWDVCLKCEGRKAVFGNVKENVNNYEARRVSQKNI